MQNYLNKKFSYKMYNENHNMLKVFKNLLLLI